MDHIYPINGIIYIAVGYKKSNSTWQHSSDLLRKDTSYL